MARRLAVLGTGAALTIAVPISGAGTATSSQRSHVSGVTTPPFAVKVIGHLRCGQSKISSGTPTGFPPSAIQSVYNLSGLSPSSWAGSGQIIAIADMYNDPNALSDLSTFNAQYGYAASKCTSSRARRLERH